MRYVESVREEYQHQNPFSLIPVETNDVVFAVHAFIVSVVTLIQCFCIYERQNQTISKPTVVLLVVFWAIAIVFYVLVVFTAVNTLVYLNLLSYIKLLISFIKYIPQVSIRSFSSPVVFSFSLQLLQFHLFPFALFQAKWLFHICTNCTAKFASTTARRQCANRFGSLLSRPDFDYPSHLESIISLFCSLISF